MRLLFSEIGIEYTIYDMTPVILNLRSPQMLKCEDLNKFHEQRQPVSELFSYEETNEVTRNEKREMDSCIIYYKCVFNNLAVWYFRR